MYVIAPGSVREDLEPMLKDRGMKRVFTVCPHLSTEDLPLRGGREEWCMLGWGAEGEEEGREGGSREGGGKGDEL